MKGESLNDEPRRQARVTSIRIWTVLRTRPQPAFRGTPEWRSRDPAAVLLGALGVSTSEVRRRLDADTPVSWVPHSQS